MKIVFFSNFLNHHQLALCLELIKHVGEGNFYFVANSVSNENCIALGYDEMNDKYPFVVRAYENKEQKEKALEMARTYDVAIIGAFSEEYLKVRMKLNMLTFVFTERFFKTAKSEKNPRALFEVFRKYTIYRFKPLYFLCASAFVHKDLSRCGFPVKKCFKWGYFTEVLEYSNSWLNEKKENGLKHSQISILCTGRLIRWKHPEMAVMLAEKLKNAKVKFELNYIGEGEMRKDLEKMVIERELQNEVHFLGSKPFREVRHYMEDADIFLFTSDRNEGWGAVLNEAMNSACAVVACNQIGSAPFLISDGKNGLLFDGTVDNLYDKVFYLCNNAHDRTQLGVEAYKTIFEIWNASNAAKTLINRINAIFNNIEINISNGPCSLASV